MELGKGKATMLRLDKPRQRNGDIIDVGQIQAASYMKMDPLISHGIPFSLTFIASYDSHEPALQATMIHVQHETLVT
jgi:hypothetical protein